MPLRYWDHRQSLKAYPCPKPSLGSVQVPTGPPVNEKTVLPTKTSNHTSTHHLNLLLSVSPISGWHPDAHYSGCLRGYSDALLLHILHPTHLTTTVLPQTDLLGRPPQSPLRPSHRPPQLRPWQQLASFTPKPKGASETGFRPILQRLPPPSAKAKLLTRARETQHCSCSAGLPRGVPKGGVPQGALGPHPQDASHTLHQLGHSLLGVGLARGSSQVHC